jgi:hypothetical protein
MTDHTANPPPKPDHDGTAPIRALAVAGLYGKSIPEAMRDSLRCEDAVRRPTLDGAPIFLGVDFGAGDSVSVTTRHGPDGRVLVVEKGIFEGVRFAEALAPPIEWPGTSARNARRLARKGRGRPRFKP